MGHSKEKRTSQQICVYIFCLRMLRVTSPKRERRGRLKEKVADVRGRGGEEGRRKGKGKKKGGKERQEIEIKRPRMTRWIE